MARALEISQGLNYFFFIVMAGSLALVRRTDAWRRLAVAFAFLFQMDHFFGVDPLVILFVCEVTTF